MGKNTDVIKFDKIAESIMFLRGHGGLETAIQEARIEINDGASLEKVLEDLLDTIKLEESYLIDVLQVIKKHKEESGA